MSANKAQQVGMMLMSRDKLAQNGLPPIVEIDCNKRQWAHLKAGDRSFVSMHSRGAMPVWEK